MKRFNLNTVPAVVVAMAAFAGFGSAAAAQESPQTFRACFVPQVGAMYLIGLEGLPGECLSGEHREISWTEGGSPEAASVDTDALQDGSVTTAKIASGAVTTAQIALGAVTADQIAPGSVDVRALDLGIETLSRDFDVRPRLSADLPSSGVFALGCPAGKEVLSGGFEFTRAFPGMWVTVSRPGQTGEVATWVVHVRNSAFRDGQVRIHLVCADLR